MKRTGKRTSKHKRACREYIKKMADEHGYIFCESKYCDDPNKQPHSVHHIMSAGRWPSHEHLHDDINLILLCHRCHTKFHQNKRLKEQEELINERGLDKLFNRR